MYLNKDSESKLSLITALHSMRATLKKAAMKVRKKATKKKKKKKSLLDSLTPEQLLLFKKGN